jgi:hypothetical protein
MKAPLLASVCACAIALTGFPAQAQVLTATQDSFANGINPTDSDGANTVIKVRGWGANNAFIQFDESSLVGRTIDSATLLIDVVEIYRGSGGTVEVRLVEDAWSEDTLTFDNQPAFSAPLATVPIGYEDVGNTVSVDITGIVQGWAEGTIPNYGLALTSSDTAKINVRLGSKERDVLAQVELKWSPPATRTDGEALSLTEIGGYVLQMNGAVLRDDISGDAVALTVDNLWPGEYCFQIATRDLDGRVGPFSPADCWSVLPDSGGAATIDINIAP